MALLGISFWRRNGAAGDDESWRVWAAAAFEAMMIAVLVKSSAMRGRLDEQRSEMGREGALAGVSIGSRRCEKSARGTGTG